jgi:putative endonuclease
MDDASNRTGRAAETAALAYLKRQGLQLVARNYRCKAGEIDLVMLASGTLALVEVRYRTCAGYGGAAGSVIYRKQRRIVQAAQHLLMTRADLRRYPARFDVVAISPDLSGLRIEWLKGAFT